MPRWHLIIRNLIAKKAYDYEDLTAKKAYDFEDLTAVKAKNYEDLNMIWHLICQKIVILVVR